MNFCNRQEKPMCNRANHVIVTFFLLHALAAYGAGQSKPVSLPASPAVLAAAELIVQGQYDESAAQLEQILVETPDEKEAAIYLATARAAREKDSLRARELLEEGLRRGGGASFIVRHSHESTLMSLGDPNDYCRGWLHFRHGEMIFAPRNSEHGVRIPFSAVSEFKQIKKYLVQVQVGKDNFAPRNRDERDALQLVIMYQKVSRK
jgi:hypothetical protein